MTSPGLLRSDPVWSGPIRSTRDRPGLTPAPRIPTSFQLTVDVSQLIFSPNPQHGSLKACQLDGVHHPLSRWRRTGAQTPIGRRHDCRATGAPYRAGDERPPGPDGPKAPAESRDPTASSDYNERYSRVRWKSASVDNSSDEYMPVSRRNSISARPAAGANVTFTPGLLTTRLYYTCAFAIVSCPQLLSSRHASRQWPHYISPPRWRQPAGAAHARMHVLLQISWKSRPRTASLELGCRDTLIGVQGHLINSPVSAKDVMEFSWSYALGLI